MDSPYDVSVDAPLRLAHGDERTAQLLVFTVVVAPLKYWCLGVG